MIASRESADLARRLIRETVEKQGIPEDQLTIHSDRGPSMKSHGVAQLLAALSITKSHSRPHVSNDNPFSESQFKTLKYRPEFPDRFGGYDDALGFCRGFFAWYNEEHYHSGIGLLTPASVHYRDADEILAKRRTVLDAAYGRNPERFVNKTPSPPDGPTAVWINPPRTGNAAADDQESPVIETQTPRTAVAAKTELEISRLTSAETSARPLIRPSGEPSLNNAAHEKGHPETQGHATPDAPLTHPRPGYPSASCVPAELASVSPSGGNSNHSDELLQPLNTRAMPQKIPGGLGDWSPRDPVTTSPTDASLH